MNSLNVNIAELLPSRSLNVATALEKSFGGKKDSVPLSEFLAQSAEAKVREVLNVPLLDVFVKAWGKYVVVLEAIQSTRTSREAAVVTLYEHEITDVEHPELQIEWAGIRHPAIRFTLEITATLGGANLEVKGGAIRSVEVGDVSLKMALSFADTKLLPDWDLGPMKVPGRFAFNAN